MSELPFDRPSSIENDEANWAFDPTTGVDTAGSVPSVPDGSRRTNGFSTTVPDRPSATHLNYLFREGLKLLVWALYSVPRSFTTLREAITATIEGDLFWLRRSPVITRMATTFSQAATAASAVQAVATDGERLYYSQLNQNIVAANKDTPGTAIWTVSPEALVPPNLVAVGDAVFTRYQSGNFYKLNRDTGATLVGPVASTPPGTTVVMKSNGDRLVTQSAADSRSIIIIDHALTGGPGTASVWGTAGAIQSLCVTHDRVIAVGTDNGSGFHIQAFDLNHNLIWQYAISTAAAVPIDCETDGNFVYCAFNATTDAGVAMNLIALGVGSGELVYRQLIGGSGVNARAVSVDDRCLFVQVDDGGQIDDYVCDKASGVALDSVLNIPTPVVGRMVRTDGEDWIHPSDDDVVTLTRSGPTKLFQRVGALDVNRRPFHTLAIPTSEQ